MSLNTILATTPLVSTNYILKATGTTIGNSLIWDNGTNVGIGNTNTSFTFDVTGNSRFTTGSKIATASGQLLVGSNTSTIGTALEVVGDIYASNKIYSVNGTAANPAIRFFAGASGLYSTTGDDLGISTNGASRLYISSAGNVGINTSSPNEKLDVNGAIQFRADTQGYATTTSVGMVDFYAGLSRMLSFGANGSTYGGFDFYQATQNNGAGRSAMRITSGGNVLIGTTSAIGVKLQVTGNTYTSEYNSWGSTYEMYLGRGNAISSFGSADFVMTNFQTSGRCIIANATTGVVLSNGATSFSAYSDERLKTIHSELQNSLEAICSLRAVKYSWKKDTENKRIDIGLIAQDVQKVLPEIIDIENDEIGTLSIRYTEIIPLLVAGIKEQQAQIQSLQEQINILAK